MKDRNTFRALLTFSTQLPSSNRIYYIFLLLVYLVVIVVACSDAKFQEQKEWKDSFDENIGWELSTDASATVTIEGGVLHIEVHTPGQVAWSAHESIWENFHLTLMTEQLAGPLDNEYGILIRMSGDTAFYALSISGDGFARAALFQDDVWSVLGPDWTPSPYINLGLSSNKISVTAQNGSLTFEVNNEVVLQIEDTTLSKGSIGLYAGAFGEGGVDIAFDDLQLTALP